MFREKLILLLVVASSVALQARWFSSEFEHSKKNIFKAIEQHAPNKLIRLLKNTSCDEFNEYDLQIATNLARKTIAELEIKFGYIDYAKLWLSIPCAINVSGLFFDIGERLLFAMAEAGFILSIPVFVAVGLVPCCASLIFFSYQFYKSSKKYKQYKAYTKAKTILNILENHHIGICLELQLPKNAINN